MTGLDPKKLDTLITLQKKQVSLKWNFYRGILYGLGFFIGSALLIGIIIGLLSTINTIPIVGEYTVKIIDFIQQNK